MTKQELKTHMETSKRAAFYMRKKCHIWKFDIEDYIQAAYEGMCHAINSFNPEKSSLDKWIFSCAVNFIYQMLDKDDMECSQHIRRTQNPKFSYSTKIIYFLKHEDDISVDIFDLDEAIKKLVPNQRRVISLLRQGYNQADIGRIMGISKQGVNQHYFSAIKKLRKYMTVRELYGLYE